MRKQARQGALPLDPTKGRRPLETIYLRNRDPRASGPWQVKGRALAFLSFVLLSSPVLAQDSPNTTVKLIQLLIKTGVLKPDQAASLLAEARRESASPAHPHVAKRPAAAIPPPDDGAVHVAYVPQIVRDQIAAQVKEQVLAEAQQDGWAQPNEYPGWVSRVTLFGDIRTRYERDFLSMNKANGATPFVDYGTINNGAGYDVSGNSGLPPLLDSTEDRTRFRLRARLGADIAIDDWITAQVRVATGNDDNPVSLNQTLGVNGGFAKYQLWLDRAYLRLLPLPELSFNLGRGPNPFWTSDLIFGPDVEFDGLAAQSTLALTDNVHVFVNAGAFPFFDTAFNFSTSNDLTATSSRDQYLFAGQAGAEWTVNKDYFLHGAVGFFHFNNIQGEESSPCEVGFTCNTDDSRAIFYGTGNTLFGTRDIVLNPAEPLAAQLQYFGRAARFGELDLHGAVDYRHYAPVDVTFEGEFIKNLEYNRAAILAHTPVNNLGSNGAYQGGDTAYMLKLTIGHELLDERWKWNTAFAYKYLESDSLVDALDDPDFHTNGIFGGTNAKGYVVSGNLAVSRAAYLTLRWLSANAVSGPPRDIDVLQLDLNARF